MKENIEIENEIMAIINYFKLIYILKLTKDKSLDSFIMLKGKYLLDNLSSNDKYIKIDDNNLSLLFRLSESINEIKKVNYSMSPILVEELENIGWITDIISSINPEEKYYDTITINASEGVLNNLLPNYHFNLLTYYNSIAMKEVTKELKKDIKNSHH